MDYLAKIAAALDVPTAALLPGSPMPPPVPKGASDRGRDWEGPAAERRPGKRPAPLAITGAQFRDVFVPLIRRIAGDAAAERIARKDHGPQAAALMRILAEEDETGLSVTSRLTQYLLTAAAAASSIPPDDPRYDYRQWRDQSEKAAAYLLALGADGARKSG